MFRCTVCSDAHTVFFSLFCACCVCSLYSLPLRMFVRNRVPYIRYHNENLSVNIIGAKEKDFKSYIKVTTGKHATANTAGRQMKACCRARRRAGLHKRSLFATDCWLQYAHLFHCHSYIGSCHLRCFVFFLSQPLAKNTPLTQQHWRQIQMCWHRLWRWISRHRNALCCHFHTRSNLF